MITRRTAMVGSALAVLLAATQSSAASGGDTKVDIQTLPRKKVKLVAPPFVHEHEQVAKDGPAVIEFTLTIEEKATVIDDDGTQLHAMTYDGSIPGPLMVVHQGDYVELTLINPETNAMPHNIDFHAATGALGGGALTLINPGERVTLRFKADRSGTLCITARRAVR